MYEYIPIDAVLTRVPQAIKDEESEPMIKKWALDCYLQNEKIVKNKLEDRFAISRIENHVGQLPKGFKGLVEASFSEQLPNSITDDSSTIWLLESIDGNHVTIFQTFIYQYFKPYSYNMFYAGQSSDLVYNDCVNLLCDGCINFSIDRQFETITTDVEDGYVLLVYQSQIKDEDNNFLIPKVDVLLDALGKYCIAQHYLEASLRREGGAYEMYQQFKNESNLLFSEYQKRHLLKKFDWENYVNKTRGALQTPAHSYQFTRTNYWK